MFTRSTDVMPYSTHVKRTRWLANTTSNSLDGFDGGAGKDYVLRGIRSFTQYTTWYRNWGFVEANSHAFIDQYYPQARREADANVIDAGAGLVTMLGGWGDDAILGCAGMTSTTAARSMTCCRAASGATASSAAMVAISGHRK